MSDQQASDSGGPYVVIGETHVARRVCAALVQRGCEVLHLIAPGDEELREAMIGEPSGLAVLLHDDVAALRYALAAAHIAPDVPLVVTIFDQTVSGQLRAAPARVPRHVLRGPGRGHPGRPVPRARIAGHPAYRRRAPRRCTRPAAWWSSSPGRWDGGRAGTPASAG